MQMKHLRIRDVQRPSVAHFALLALLITAGHLSRATAADASGSIAFARDIRPLLADNCFACHGPDENKRSAGLRLDTEAGLHGKAGSGFAVVPGKPGDSELFRRITHADPNKRMPHKSSGKQLTDDQIALIKRWIKQGADWQGHWAFVTPHRPTPPAIAGDNWSRNAIDRFVLARLKREDLTPSPEADRRTLIRRVTFDLTGLPPTADQITAFVNDTRPDAYEKVVDRLLASKHYGEHMTRYWLDIARYGDTHGLHLDNYREMWPYRDWVINAFNSNKPYDRFIIEQLAGDLLPDPTPDQLLATAFNRQTLTNTEGGTDQEQWRVEAVFDRV